MELRKNFDERMQKYLPPKTSKAVKIEDSIEEQIAGVKAGIEILREKAKKVMRRSVETNTHLTEEEIQDALAIIEMFYQFEKELEELEKKQRKEENLQSQEEKIM